MSAIASLDFRSAAFATLTVMLQIPLVAMRWHSTLDAPAALDVQMTRAAITVITAISTFFALV